MCPFKTLFTLLIVCHLITHTSWAKIRIEPKNEILIPKTENSMTKAVARSSISNGSRLQWFDPIAMEVTFEGFNNDLDGPRTTLPVGLQNFALGADFDFSQEVSVMAEILGEASRDTTNVFIGELFFSYQPKGLRGLNFRLGQFYYDQGLLVQKEGFFFQRPGYYRDLLVTRRGLDIGGQVAWKPFRNQKIEITYSIFGGNSYRSGDQQYLRPTILPQSLGVSYQSSYFQAQAQSLLRHYAGHPQLLGIGLSLQGPKKPLQWNGVQFFPFMEVWNLNYSNNQRATQNRSWASTAGFKLQFWRLFYRPMFSWENWRTHDSTQGPLNKSFSLHGVGLLLGKNLRLEYQRTLDRERQSRSEIQLIDAHALRLVFVRGLGSPSWL